MCGISRARCSSFHSSNGRAAGISKPSRNGPSMLTSPFPKRVASTSTQPFASEFGFDNRQPLSERMVRKLGRCVRPEQIGEVIAGELLAGIEREPDQKSKMFPRTKPYLLASHGEQGGTAKTMQQKMVTHVLSRVLLIRHSDKASESTMCQHIDLLAIVLKKVPGPNGPSTTYLRCRSKRTSRLRSARVPRAPLRMTGRLFCEA